jgi:hypothetical protein
MGDETTLVYLRRKDKARGDGNGSVASWGRVFPSSEEAAYRKAPKYGDFLEEAHTGSEHACKWGFSGAEVGTGVGTLRAILTLRQWKPVPNRLETLLHSRQRIADVIARES